jgi:hypothetical protein
MTTYAYAFLEVGGEGFAYFNCLKWEGIKLAFYKLEKRGLHPKPSFDYMYLRSIRVLDKPRTDGEERFVLHEIAEADVKRGMAEWWGSDKGFIYYKTDAFLTWAYASELKQIYPYSEDVPSLLRLTAIVEMMEIVSGGDDKGARLIIWAG